MIDSETRKVAETIGQFYLEKNGGDYEACRQEIEKLAITGLAVEDGKVTITTARPGWLIGKRGTNIDALAGRLNREIKIIEAPVWWPDVIAPENPDYPTWDLFD